MERVMWEYKVVIRAREVLRPGVAVAQLNLGGVTEFTPNGDEMLAQLEALGRDGWELVGMTARASQLNSPMTSEEVWVFKRPCR